MTFSPAVAEETAEEIITVAYDSGINLFDLSEAYSGGRAEVRGNNSFFINTDIILLPW